MNQKVLGSLLGAAVGDAMGAATEGKSTNQIIKIFGGKVKEFVEPPADVPARGREPGQVTDAFSIPYILIEHLIREGKFSRKMSVDALYEWGKTEYFGIFAGMTTKNVINRLNENKKMDLWSYSGQLGSKLYKGHYYALSSNGAASKAFPEGLLSNGDIEKAIRDTVEVTMASHDDPYSISGACAVAAAVSEAMKTGASLYGIIEAAHEGSIKGEVLAREKEDIWTYPGPSVTKRIEMATEIAMHCGSAEDIITELKERIGSGPAISETVPMALGILIANQGDTMKSICEAVNVGDETCAIACIVGAVAGTLNGSGSIPERYLDIIEKKNQMNLRRQAEEIEKLWKE